MHLPNSHAKPWLRYSIAVAALFWALGVAGGCCHLVRTAIASPHTSSMSTTAADHHVATKGQTALGADVCSPLAHDCGHGMRAYPSTTAVLAGVFVAAAALLGSRAWPVVSVPRAPPRAFSFAPYRSGRNTLTRLCVSRI